MSPGDDLSPAVETVEQLSVPLPEFAPDRLRLGRHQPRRPVAEGAEDVLLRIGRGGIAARRSVAVTSPVAFVCHGRGWARTDKCFSLARRGPAATTPARDRRPVARADGQHGDTETDRRPGYMRSRGLPPDMDGVEHGVPVESEPEADEPFDLGAGFDSRRAVVEFLTVLALVMVLAAATSVVLVPA